MAYSITSQSGNVRAYVTEYVADSPSDLNDIPTNNAAPGSTCIVISTGDVYMLNNSKEWVLL